MNPEYVPRQTTCEPVTTTISPAGGLDVLSRDEVRRLRDASDSGLHALLRRCALAVLTSGAMVDDPRHSLQHPDFDIQVWQQDRGVRIELINAPAMAFVDGQIIRGVNELLMAVVRDVVYVATAMDRTQLVEADSSTLTHVVFEILRNARVLVPRQDPALVVCWGGHAISRREYDYTKDVGYQMGLRMLDVCTGCGPGAMKGPMKGANVAHAKQRREGNRYIGITEPGIIAAESPNPIVNRLVIMPDIEKRLEAFVRLGHGFAVFPGGVGTCEEILYLLGILLHPDNADIPFPLVLSGPPSAADYFDQIDRFLRLALGDEASRHYRIIIDDPVAVAQAMADGVDAVQNYRRSSRDAFHFNWGLTVPRAFQQPFKATHEAVASLRIQRDRPAHELAADLRCVFSAIVAGNVKEDGMTAIEQYGPFRIDGERDIMQALDELLQAFVEQGRMQLPGGGDYVPCYRIGDSDPDAA